jgi:uncharacterized protein involved in outer membrane biogenesis
MIRKAILVVLAVVIAAGIALALYARSVLASDNVRATLEAQLSASFGQPVRIGNAGASVFPRVALQLSDVAIGNPASVTVEQASVSTGLRGLFSRRIEDAEVVLAGGRVLLPAALALTTQAGDPGTQSSAEDGALTIVSVRLISLRNVQFVVGPTSLRFDMESALAGDRLDVSRLTATSERTKLEASGALTSVSASRGAFTVKAGVLDLDELINLASGFTTPVQEATDADRPSSAATMRLTLDITAPSGSLAGYGFSELTTKLEGMPSRILMEPLSLRAFGGTFKGKLEVNTSSSTPALTLRGNIAGINVARLAESAGIPGSISGSLGGTVALKSQGTDSAALVRSAHGSAAAAITNGSIPGLDMVRTIVLAFGKPSGAPPAGSGSAFTHLGGDFVIQNGVVRSDNLTFASRDFDMHGRASLRVQSGALVAVTDVELSKELTAQAGTDLRRYAQSDGRIVLPAHITGTIAQPSITLDLAAATRRALENELKRRAKSLLGDLFRKKKGGGS